MTSNGLTLENSERLVTLSDEQDMGVKEKWGARRLSSSNWATEADNTIE